jgi:hypothetical protein
LREGIEQKRLTPELGSASRSSFTATLSRHIVSHAISTGKAERKNDQIGNYVWHVGLRITEVGKNSPAKRHGSHKVPARDIGPRSNSKNLRGGLETKNKRNPLSRFVAALGP